METNSQTKLSKQRIPQYVENALINVNPSGCLDSRERRIKRRETSIEDRARQTSKILTEWSSRTETTLSEWDTE